MTSDRRTDMARVVPLAVIALAIVYLLATALRQMGDVALGDRLFQLVAVWYLVPGALVILRRNGHVIGWLLVASGLAWAIQLNTEVLGGGLAWMPLPWLAWLNEWIVYAQWTGTVALFVLFPGGFADRTPRQRRVGRVMIVTAFLSTVAAMFTSQVGGEFVHGVQRNPTGLGLLPQVVVDFLIIPVALVGLGSVIHLWLRARDVTGAQRRQYTWVLFAFSVVMAGLLFGLAFGAPSVLGDVAWLPIVVGWFLVPTAFSVAILRHRLYDIDRIVSRTVAYAVITAVVTSIYAIPVVTLPEFFDLRGPLPVAAATLAAAAAFTPVRRVVQQWVDRRFNRAHFDARRELDVFTARLRSQVDLDTLVADINALVETNLQPSVAVTWIRPRNPESESGTPLL